MGLFFQTPKGKIPADLQKIPPPRIGFFGNNDYRLDFDLITKAAQDHSDWSFIFLGPINYNPEQDKIINFEKCLKKLKKEKNICFLGPKPTKKDLIPYLDYFDIAWIPYNVDYQFVRYSYPMKVFEYFARGKPVLSTPIESFVPLSPLVQIVKNPKEFSQKAGKILKDKWPEKYIKKQKQTTIDNSWQAKLEKISQILKNEFPERLKN